MHNVRKCRDRSLVGRLAHCLCAVVFVALVSVIVSHCVIAPWFLFYMAVQWTRQQYVAVNWNAGMPLDTSDFRIRFKELCGVFSGCLGMLYWVAILKIPMGRKAFTASYVSCSSVLDVKQRIFKACQEACRLCASSSGKQQFDAECRGIRGPLKQQGFIQEMKRMHVIVKTAGELFIAARS